MQCLVAEGGAIQVLASTSRFESQMVEYGIVGTRVAGELAVWRERLFLQVGVDLLAALVPIDLGARAFPISQLPHVAGGVGIGLLYAIEKTR
jgi:hypothetical protein